MPSRGNQPNRRRPGPQPVNDPDAIQLEADQFALDLGDDSVQLIGDDIRLMGDDASDDVDVDAGPPRPDQVEAEAMAEVSELLQGFRQRERNEQQRFEDATDTEYWFALCFQTREQKEQFLHAMGWFELGDKYIDGMAAAERAGVELTARIPPMPRANVDRQLADLAE